MKRGRPRRDEAEQQLRLFVACIVKAKMDAGATLEKAAQATADAAAEVGLQLVREWRTAAPLREDGFTDEQVKRLLKIAPTGPPWPWKISASTAKKAYVEHFGDGSRSCRKTDTGRPE